MLQLAATAGATALETLRTVADDIVCLTTVAVRKWETLSFISNGIEKVYQFFLTFGIDINKKIEAISFKMVHCIV
jgi:hypothetical protein